MIRVDTSNTKVVWLTKNKNAGKLLATHGVLYLICLAPNTPPKLGEVAVRDCAGMTPQEVPTERYAAHDTFGANPVVLMLIIFDKSVGVKDYDTAVRKRIQREYLSGKLPFGANYGTVQIDNTNREALIGYDHQRHSSFLRDVIARHVGYVGNTLAPFVPRFGQDENIKDVVRILRKSGRAVMASYTGSGKSRKALRAMCRILGNTGGLVLLTTPITDTLDSFCNDIANVQLTDDPSTKLTFLSAKELKRTSVASLVNRVNAGELIVIGLTVQDLTWDDNSVNPLRVKYLSLIGKIDFWIRDERHLYYGGQKTKPRLENMTARYILDVTATPYNFMNEVGPEQIASQTLLWALRNRANTGVPAIQIDVISEAMMQIPKAYTALYGTEEGYTPTKLFLRDNRNWTYQQAIIDLMCAFYHSPLSRGKNPLSIVNDNSLCAVSKRVGMIVCPGGENGDSAEERLPDLAALLNKQGFVGRYYVSSYEIEEQGAKRGMTVGQYVQHLSQNQNVTILTCRKFTTGTDIPELGHIVLLAGFENYAAFEQLLGRMVRKLAVKTDTKMYCLAPGKDVKLKLYELANAQVKLDPAHTAKEYCECLPLTVYEGGAYRKTPVENILELGRLSIADTLRTRIATDPIYSALESGLAGLSDTELDEFLEVGLGTRKQLKLALTDDNGAKTRKLRTNPKTKQPNTRKEQSRLDMLMEVVQSITQDVVAAAFMAKCYDLDALLKKNDFLEKLFGTRLNTYRTLVKYSALRASIEKQLEKQNVVFGAAKLEDIYASGAVFINTEFKTKQGLVYTPYEVAKHLIEKVESDNLCVDNALNGVWGLFAENKVTCVEHYPYFHSMLTQMGHTVTDEVGVKNMQFSANVGNPPYQGNKKLGKKLWQEVVKKQYERTAPNGMLADITPASILAPTTLAWFMENVDLQEVDLTVRKHFPGVGSTFAAWIAQKRPYRGKTKFITDEGVCVVDLREYEVLPKKVTPTTLSLTKKFFGTANTLPAIRPTSGGFASDDLRDDASKSHPFAVFYGGKVKYAPFASNNYADKKVVMTLSGYQTAFYLPNCSTSEYAVTVDVKNATEGKRLEHNLNGKLYQVMMAETKHGAGFHLITILRRLPAVDLTRDWTDEALYKHFGLTKAEIAYVESRI